MNLYQLAWPSVQSEASLAQLFTAYLASVLKFHLDIFRSLCFIFRSLCLYLGAYAEYLGVYAYIFRSLCYL